MATITSANSTLAISVTNLYPVPQIIQGFAADDAFMQDAVDQAEIVMGIDGKMSAGFIFNPVKMTITVMPNSPSYQIFADWMLAQRTAREVYTANASIYLPAISRKFTLFNGVLTSGKQLPDVKKVLQAVPFVITFERVTSEATL